jgi:hypothetical protein
MILLNAVVNVMNLLVQLKLATAVGDGRAYYCYFAWFKGVLLHIVCMYVGCAFWTVAYKLLIDEQTLLSVLVSLHHIGYFGQWACKEGSNVSEVARSW